jgi:hypothetical protein
VVVGTQAAAAAGSSPLIRCSTADTGSSTVDSCSAGTVTLAVDRWGTWRVNSVAEVGIQVVAAAGNSPSIQCSVVDIDSLIVDRCSVVRIGTLAVDRRDIVLEQ